ncbi:sulfotransferase family 2 domain-containing protein [Congregibacter variabilis]|uniref:Sulfotransferase family 2 domain-containing protein n=1 Tax=Congregibacter variabilis TaxID=3081200 RepID=A0ABZ0I6A9_9GAMM|nr:sulfotransferase family 2 domain-containing protein [Congregibacter sp. IMCC43200]
MNDYTSTSTAHRTPVPLVNLERKFILFTNAKCGGTGLKAWFLSSLDLESSFCSFSRAASHYGLRHALSWFLRYRGFPGAHLPRHDDDSIRIFTNIYRRSTSQAVEESIRSDQFFKVIVVRDPYDRLVSAFVDKFCTTEAGKPWVQQVIRQVNAGVSNGGASAATITFSQFVDYLSKQNLSKVDEHWRPQSCVLQDVSPDQIVSLDSLAAGLRSLEDRFNFTTPLVVSKRRQSNEYDGMSEAGLGDVDNVALMQLKANSGAFPSKNSFYDDSIRDKVLRLYADDFFLYRQVQ